MKCKHKGGSPCHLIDWFEKNPDKCPECVIEEQAEQIQALSDEVNRQRNNEKGRKPSCLINLDLRKELERLKEICEKQDDYIDRICTVGFDDFGADMYKEIIDLREALAAQPQEESK